MLLHFNSFNSIDVLQIYLRQSFASLVSQHQFQQNYYFFDSLGNKQLNLPEYYKIDMNKWKNIY